MATVTVRNTRAVRRVLQSLTGVTARKVRKPERPRHSWDLYCTRSGEIVGRADWCEDTGALEIDGVDHLPIRRAYSRATAPRARTTVRLPLCDWWLVLARYGRHAPARGYERAAVAPALRALARGEVSEPVPRPWAVPGTVLRVTLFADQWAGILSVLGCTGPVAPALRGFVRELKLTNDIINL